MRQRGAVGVALTIGIGVAIILVIGALYTYTYFQKRKLLCSVADKAANNLVQIVPDFGQVAASVLNAESAAQSYAESLGLLSSSDPQLTPLITRTPLTTGERVTYIAVLIPGDMAELGRLAPGGPHNDPFGNEVEPDPGANPQWIVNNPTVTFDDGVSDYYAQGSALHLSMQKNPARAYVHATMSLFGVATSMSCSAYGFVAPKAGFPGTPEFPPPEQDPEGLPVGSPNPTGTPGPYTLPSPGDPYSGIADCGDSFPVRDELRSQCEAMSRWGVKWNDSGAPEPPCGCCVCMTEDEAKAQTPYKGAGSGWVYRGHPFCSTYRCIAPIRPQRPVVVVNPPPRNNPIWVNPILPLVPVWQNIDPKIPFRVNPPPPPNSGSSPSSPAASTGSGEETGGSGECPDGSWPKGTGAPGDPSCGGDGTPASGDTEFECLKSGNSCCIYKPRGWEDSICLVWDAQECEFVKVEVPNPPCGKGGGAVCTPGVGDVVTNCDEPNCTAILGTWTAPDVCECADGFASSGICDPASSALCDPGGIGAPNTTCERAADCLATGAGASVVGGVPPAIDCQCTSGNFQDDGGGFPECIGGGALPVCAVIDFPTGELDCDSQPANSIPIGGTRYRCTNGINGALTLCYPLPVDVDDCFQTSLTEYECVADDPNAANGIQTSPNTGECQFGTTFVVGFGCD